MPNKIKYPIIDGKKECGDCHQFKTIDHFKKARKHFTSRCHECLKIYAANYRARPETKEKAAQYYKDYRSNPENRQKINARNKIYRKTTKYRKRINAQRRKWATFQKQQAVEYKGGECVCCGYKACLAALEFHHPDPSIKDGYGTGALKAHWTFEKNKKELDKCILVCVRCHREIHAGARSISES